MNVTNAMKEAIRSVVNQKYAPLRKPYEESIGKKTEALNAIKERASEVYELVMLEAYESVDRIPRYSAYENRASFHGLKPEFDTSEEWQAMNKINEQVNAAVSAIIMQLTLMSRVDIMGVIEKYFENNPVA